MQDSGGSHFEMLPINIVRGRIHVLHFLLHNEINVGEHWSNASKIAYVM